MNTHGHHSCAEEAGEPVLREALKAAGQSHLPIHAFYMGNWLTDVSQGVDPVAYANALTMIGMGVPGWSNVIAALLTETESMDEDHTLRESCDAAIDDKMRKDVRQARDEADRARAVHGEDSPQAQEADAALTRAEQEYNSVAQAEQEAERARTVHGPASQEAEQAQGELKRVCAERRANNTQIVKRFESRSSILGKAMFNAFKVVGFFKFACPTKPQREVMHPDIYCEVFDRHFTQYYPHEHMDRPERANYPYQDLDGADKKKDKDDDDKHLWADKVTGQTRYDKVSLDPDIYDYMRDHIQIASGLLADLDVNWAYKYFRPNQPAWDAMDLDWHLGLAKLGHALHPVEDFFAHSNFAEHATKTMTPDHREQFIGEEDELYNQRLLKLQTKRQAEKAVQNIGKAPWDPHVVTGYFDFRDTIVSLTHILENLFLKKFGSVDHHGHGGNGHGGGRDGGHGEKPFKWDWTNPDFWLRTDWTQKVKDELKHYFGSEENEKARRRMELRLQEKEKEHGCEKNAKKILTDTLIFIDNPEAAKRAHREEPSSILYLFQDAEGRWKREYFKTGKESDQPDPRKVAQRIVDEHPLFNAESITKHGKALGRATPDVIKKSFVEAVVLLTQKTSTGMFDISLYDVLNFADVVLNKPLEAVLIFFGEWAGFYKLAEELVKSSSAFYNFVAGDRVGCHSKLAKDHGPHGLLYQQQRNCALAVHWYVVRTLTRWSRPKPALLRRSPRDAAGQEKLNRLDLYHWIEWLELLEWFLRHPAGRVTGERKARPYTLLNYRIRKGDSLATLAKKFKEMAYDPASFNWQLIAEANFGTAVPREINRQLRETVLDDELPMGLPAGDGKNYMFRRGVPIKIPGLRAPLLGADPADKERAWYRPVMLDWKYIRAREDCLALPKDYRPVNFHTLLYVPLEDVKALIRQADQMRDEASEAYMPEYEHREDLLEGPGTRYPPTLRVGHTLDGKLRVEDQYVCTHYPVEVLAEAGYRVDWRVRDQVHMPMPQDEVPDAVRGGAERIKGVARALVISNQGRYIHNLADLKPGDFVQYWFTKNGKIDGHCGQVERVVKADGSVIDLHGCHADTGKVEVLRGVKLGSMMQVYAARPKGNE